MMMNFYSSKWIRSAAAAAFLCMSPALSADSSDSGKNVLNVEWRILPGDYEKLYTDDSSRWNSNFRLYDKTAASLLWTDPIAIRDLPPAPENAAPQTTALYACCDEEGLTVLVYGAHEDPSAALKDGKPLPVLRLEMFLLPGDADDPQIQNYHPFAFQSAAPHLQYHVSWMKFDRKNRPLFPSLILGSRPVPGGTVCRITFPWFHFRDHLPFTKKKDNFWRLSMIRWETLSTSVTWGGPVHQQISPGYLRMPDFTQEQKTAIMKHVLLKIWSSYQDFRRGYSIDPALVSGRGDHYRMTQKHFPHTWANFSEDIEFQDAWLLRAVGERDALGAGIASFDKMSPAEQTAFYDRASRLLCNFRYDLQDAYEMFLKQKIMKQ